MNVTKEVVARIKYKLEKEQRDLRHNCSRNKHNIKKLVEDQEVMKREIALLGEMIRDLG
jgi:hypothetical protein